MTQKQKSVRMRNLDREILVTETKEGVFVKPRKFDMISLVSFQTVFARIEDAVRHLKDMGYTEGWTSNAD